MTSISTSPISQTMSFNKDMFSDSSMRPHLETYFEEAYAPVRERIADMKEAESSGPASKALATANGSSAVELSAAQYEAMIPIFDKWLEAQQTLSIFDMQDQITPGLEHAEQHLESIEADLNPDSPSNVRAVFSEGEKILAYITGEGALVTHEGGAALQKIAEQADKLKLTGEARIAYMKEQGEKELSGRHADLEVTSYSHSTTPTRREFAEKWYPEHDVDDAYETALKEARESLAQQQALHKQQTQNLDNMRMALLRIMEEAQADGAY